MDLIYIMKDPETIIDALSIFGTDRKGFIDEYELGSMLRKYALGLKDKKLKKFLKN